MNVSENAPNKISQLYLFLLNSVPNACALSFHISGFGIYIHEKGHAIALQILFSDCAPSIEVSFFRGGRCNANCRSNAMTPIGAWFGVKGSKAMIAVSGVIASVLSFMVLSKIADRITDSYPKTSYLVLALGQTLVWKEFLYSLDSLGTDLWYDQNDFRDFQEDSGLSAWWIPVGLIACSAVYTLSMDLKVRTTDFLQFAFQPEQQSSIYLFAYVLWPLPTYILQEIVRMGFTRL